MKIYDLLIESFAPTMKAVLKELADILEKYSIQYIIGGANALSTYSDHPRTTNDIDVFVNHKQKNQLENLLIDNKFDIAYLGKHQSKFKKNNVYIDLLYAANNAEISAINNFEIDVILDVNVRVPTSESLLWLYVLSDKDQNFVDAIELIKSVPQININWVKKNLTNIELKKLNKIISRSKRQISERKISRE